MPKPNQPKPQTKSNQQQNCRNHITTTNKITQQDKSKLTPQQIKTIQSNQPRTNTKPVNQIKQSLKTLGQENLYPNQTNQTPTYTNSNAQKPQKKLNSHKIKS